jgi:hypothetical protein
MKILEGHVIENLPVRQAGDELIPIDFNWSNDNLLINGNFDIWQRGISQNDGGIRSADRWYRNFGNTPIGMYTMSRQTFPTGQTDVPNNPPAFLRNEVIEGTAENQLGGISYVIGDDLVRQLEGRTVVLSFWAKADKEKDMWVDIAHAYRDEPMTIVTVEATTIPLTTSWKKYVVILKIPSAEGVPIIGIRQRVNLRFNFQIGSESYVIWKPGMKLQSGIFDIAQVKLEFGDRATPFVPRTPTEELLLCQRYFQFRSANNVNLLDLRPTMRINPTITHRSDLGLWAYDAEII